MNVATEFPTGRAYLEWVASHRTVDQINALDRVYARGEDDGEHAIRWLVFVAWLVDSGRLAGGPNDGDDAKAAPEDS